jgi:hypothetical protein
MNQIASFYNRKNRVWEHITNYCNICKKNVSAKNTDKHLSICEQINTIKENDMPVRRVVKNGKIYYQWGEQGKLYESKEQAEKQGQAVYAQGYKKEKK